MRSEFHFRPVGQGLFYTGRILDFDFVYDCGARPGVDNARRLAEGYAKDVNSRLQLDMLVISHFDYDHINAIPELLSKLNKVDTIVLPYIFPAQRLYLAMKNYGFIQNNLTPDNLYFQFITDPIGFFRRFESSTNSRIVLIGPGDPSDEDSPPPGTSEYNSNEELFIEWGVRREESQLFRGILEFEQPAESDIDKIHPWDHRRVALLNTKIWSVPSWYFKFYNHPYDIDGFYGCMEGKSLTRRGLENLLSDKAKTKELRECYKHISEDLNDTSLLMYHAPILFAERSHEVFVKVSNLINHPSRLLVEHVVKVLRSARALNHSVDTLALILGHENRCVASHSAKIIRDIEDELPSAFGQILLGDINLETNDVWQGVKTHYHHQLGDIFLALVPHHGSQHNWNDELLSRADCCMLWVISAGLGNQYGHPQQTVVNAIPSNERRLVSVNQATGFKLELDFSDKGKVAMDYYLNHRG